MNISSLPTHMPSPAQGHLSARPLSGVQVISSLAISLLFGGMTLLPLAIPAFFIILIIMSASNSNRGEIMQPSRNQSSGSFYVPPPPKNPPRIKTRAGVGVSYSAPLQPSGGFAGRSVTAHSGAPPGVSMIVTTPSAPPVAPSAKSLIFTTPILPQNSHAPTGTRTDLSGRVLPDQR